MNTDLNSIESVSLYLLQENTGQIEGVPTNPRLIKNQQFESLKNSILNFPQMLNLRPITYAGDYVALGGNQRRAALLDIAKMNFKQIAGKLGKSPDFESKTEAEQNAVLQYWEAFAADEDKAVPAQNASNLSAEQMAEFVIKDNVQFGENDYALLANEWDIEKIKEWGFETPAEWDQEPAEPEAPHAKLTDTFIVPPFTVLDTRQGYWMQRKSEWRGLINDKGESREGTLSESELMGGINSGVS